MRKSQNTTDAMDGERKCKTQIQNTRKKRYPCIPEYVRYLVFQRRLTPSRAVSELVEGTVQRCADGESVLRSYAPLGLFDAEFVPLLIKPEKKLINLSLSIFGSWVFAGGVNGASGDTVRFASRSYNSCVRILHLSSRAGCNGSQ